MPQKRTKNANRSLSACILPDEHDGRCMVPDPVHFGQEVAKVAKEGKFSLDFFSCSGLTLDASTSPEDLTEMAYNGQIESLGGGVHRRGYSCPNGCHVIKVAKRNRYAKAANAAEVKLWRKVVKTADAEILCPIRAASSDSTWLVMDFVNIGVRTPTNAEKRAIRRIVEKWDIHDIHRGNFGVHPKTGKIVITDYGMQAGIGI